MNKKLMYTLFFTTVLSSGIGFAMDTPSKVIQDQIDEIKTNQATPQLRTQIQRNNDFSFLSPGTAEGIHDSLIARERARRENLLAGLSRDLEQRAFDKEAEEKRRIRENEHKLDIDNFGLEVDTLTLEIENLKSSLTNINLGKEAKEQEVKDLEKQLVEKDEKLKAEIKKKQAIASASVDSTREWEEMVEKEKKTISTLHAKIRGLSSENDMLTIDKEATQQKLALLQSKLAAVVGTPSSSGGTTAGGSLTTVSAAGSSTAGKPIVSSVIPTTTTSSGGGDVLDSTVAAAKSAGGGGSVIPKASFKKKEGKE
ncbi:MAG: hypothetical protein K2W94_04450 [Alphaproteobacteria bacterium]|nr:hypothetical protein [Alphaproteobacteria bacterium]